MLNCWVPVNGLIADFRTLNLILSEIITLKKTALPPAASKIARLGVATTKRAAVGLVVLLLSLPANSQDKQLVLLAAHRLGRVEVLDPTTLAPIGSIHVLPLADGIESSPDGAILFIREGIAPDFKGCCALYALNLETVGRGQRSSKANQLQAETISSASLPPPEAPTEKLYARLRDNRPSQVL
jgi:hypothetical protein